MSRVHELGQLGRDELVAQMAALAGWTDEKLIDTILGLERGKPPGRSVQFPEVRTESRHPARGGGRGMVLLFRHHEDMSLFEQWLRGEGWTAFTDRVQDRS